MNAYIYRAAWICEECVQDGGVGEPDECEDSHCCPQGPYPDGGGEADSPAHCDACSVFLENPLTDDGREYVRDYMSDDTGAPWGDPAIVQLWADFYRLGIAS